MNTGMMYGFIKDVLGALFKFRRLRLSRAEKEILIAAVETGEVRKLYADAFGHWVRAGREQNFFRPGDPAYRATYLEALDRLVSRGLVRHEAEILYRLTGSGHAQAKRLVKKMDQPSKTALPVL